MQLGTDLPRTNIQNKKGGAKRLARHPRHTHFSRAIGYIRVAVLVRTRQPAATRKPNK